MIEKWRDVVGYKGYYEVSNLGNVRSKERQVIRKNGNPLNLKAKAKSMHLTKDGYYQTQLCKNSKQKSYKVHRLVALAFVDGYADGLEVNHIDGNKLNNCASNLEWVTRADNLKHSYENGLQKNSLAKIKELGDSNRKLSNEQITKIKKMLMHNSVKKIAKRFSVSESTIRNIKNNRQLYVQENR